MTGDTHNHISGGTFFSTVIQGRDLTVQLPPQVTPALSGLPAGSPAFTGRIDDLQTVLDGLAPHATATGETAAGSAVVVTAVGGMGGVGKTELAVQAARAALARGWFPGGVLFADMFGYDPTRRVEVGQALEGFLRALGIPGEHVPDLDQDRARLYTSVLAAYAREGRRILVVVDNVSGADQAVPLLPTDGVNGAVITSRDTLSMLGARLLDLDVLDVGDAVALLHRALNVARPQDSRVAGHPDDAAAVVRLCGGLPLALRIVAALLVEDPARSLAQMAVELRDEQTRLEELSHADVAVRTAFDLSYRRVDAGLARLFGLLPVNPGPDISTDAAAVLAGIEVVQARRGLEALARAHLIERGGGYGRWRMHDLIRLFAHNSGAEEREAAFARLLDHYLTSTRAATAHLDPAIAQPAARGFADRAQAVAWLDAEYPNLTAAAHAAARTAMAKDLPLAMWDFLQLRRHSNDWVILSTLALEAARHLGDRDGEGRALTTLGIALREVRRFPEAMATLQEAARLCRATGDRHCEGIALNHMASALRETRRFDEAMAVHHEVREIYRDAGNRRGEAGALYDLGVTLQQARRFAEAVTAHELDLRICRELGDRGGTASALTGLGNALHEVRRFDEAISAHQDAIQVWRELDDRHSEAVSLTSLGLALQETRRFREAVTAHQDAARICRETGDRHNEAGALYGLGLALQQVGRSDEAVTTLQDVARIYHDMDDLHREGQALTGLGLALRQVGRFEEAVTAQITAAAIFRDTGDRHSEEIALGNVELVQASWRSARARAQARRLALRATFAMGGGVAVTWWLSWQAGVAAAVVIASADAIRSAARDPGR